MESTLDPVRTASTTVGDEKDGGVEVGKQEVNADTPGIPDGGIDAWRTIVGAYVYSFVT